jgi:hypothetical protein
MTTKRLTFAILISLIFISLISGCIEVSQIGHTPLGASVNCNDYTRFVEKHQFYQDGKYKTVVTTNLGDWFYVGTDYNHTPLERTVRDDSGMMHNFDVNTIYMYTLENITLANDGIKNHCVVIP